MEAIIDQVKHLSSSADEVARKKILVALRDLMYAIESPDDTLQRIMFLHLRISIIRVGIDLKIFDLLADSQSPLSLEQLTQATGADPVLLGRILRYLSSMGMIKETGRNLFSTTNITTTLASRDNQAGIRHYFDNVGPQYQELPKFLAKSKYQNPTDNTKTVFNDAFKTELPVFLWFPHQGEAYDSFNQYMASRRDASSTWLSVYPIQEETQGWNPELPVFIDMGGGIGHQCAELKAKYPQLPGRVILQELPHCINDALPTPGVENMVHDIFQPQPVQGAKFYHLRGVLHDFPDDKCRLILQNIVPAMSKESLILIEEMVLPDTNVFWQAAQIDLTMMSALASVERTQTQWQELLDSVGLEIVKTNVYTPWAHESVLAAVPKER